MDEKINIKKVLRAFSTIITEGRQVGSKYHLNGLVAYSDFDGYTITICNDYVKLEVFFHSKFAFNYSNRKEKELFLEKIDALDRPRNTQYL